MSFFNWSRALTYVGASFALLPVSGRADSALLPARPDVLKALEHVADWQLANPCAVDIHWPGPGKAEKSDIRIGWDGTVLRKHTLPTSPSPTADLPAGWSSFIQAQRHGVAFSTLPVVVQTTWRKETGLDPAQITLINLMDEGSSVSWEMAALYDGLLALGRVSEKPIYRDALRELAQTDHWFLGERLYHADDHAVGFMYLDFYDAEKKSPMMAGVQERFDWIMRHPSHQEMNINAGQDRWTWCDALFMAPPVWLKLSKLTGDKSYLEFMDHEWWATTDSLYSPADQLFFRDAHFFDRREPNGQKVFWSRGNGWVVASLALMLEEMPKDFPTRAKYAQLFQALTTRIASLQPEDGLWRSSLLDAKSNPGPEASSTAFFCYAFARGIRLGLLDREKFLPVVTKAWIALQRCVNDAGRVGYIQQPGAAPGSANMDSTAPYGVGAYLLAGSEVYQLAKENERK